MGILTRRRHRGPSPSPASAADVAETVLRLAVLLQAGVAPVRAWGHLARTGDPAAERVSASIERGLPAPEAIATAGSGAWHEVAVACHVALVVGAPLAECLRGVAAALRDAQESADEVRVALAEPAGTARLMAWLPLVAIGLGLVLGFDTVGTLLANPFGIGCLVAGVALMIAAHRWSASLVRAAGAHGAIPGLDADLLAIALSGGVSIDRGRDLVERETGASTAHATEDILALSASAGVPAVELLRASAALARHRARVEGRLRASRLSMRLLLPLGVCTLPAFLLLGVAPMLLSVASTLPLSL